MRHHRKGKKLGRTSAHRKALYSNLAGALIEHGRIKTTLATHGLNLRGDE